MRANIGLQEPVMRLLEGEMTLQQLLVPRVHQCTVSALRGRRPEYERGRGGDSDSGAVQRAEGSSMEGRAVISGGHTKITTTSGRKKNNDNDDGDRG